MSHGHHHHHGGPPPYGPPMPQPQQVPGAPGYAYMPTPVVMPMPVYQPPPMQPPHAIDPAYSQPTYVTNVYYQQPAPPEPVHVVESTWKPPIKNPPGSSSYTHSVQRPGYQSWCWCQHQCSCCCRPPSPPTQCLRYAAPPPQPYDMIDWVPCTPSQAPSYAHRAVVAGKEGWDGSPLWVIRAHHSGDLVPGKLAVKHRSAYIAYSGKEVPVHNFELLTAPAHAVRWLPAKNGQVPIGAIAAGNTLSGEPLYVGRAKHMRSITPGKVHPSHGCLYISFGGNEVPHKDYEVLCRVVG